MILRRERRLYKEPAFKAGLAASNSQDVSTTLLVPVPQHFCRQRKCHACYLIIYLANVQYSMHGSLEIKTKHRHLAR